MPELTRGSTDWFVPHRGSDYQFPSEEYYEEGVITLEIENQDALVIDTTLDVNYNTFLRRLVVQSLTHADPFLTPAKDIIWRIQYGTVIRFRESAASQNTYTLDLSASTGLFYTYRTWNLNDIRIPANTLTSVYAECWGQTIGDSVRAWLFYQKEVIT